METSWTEINTKLLIISTLKKTHVLLTDNLCIESILLKWYLMS